MSVTLLIVIVTGVVSYRAFQDAQLRDKLIFHPYSIEKRNEYHRFLSHGFIHADFPHALFNLYVLYSFGRHVEEAYASLFGSMGVLMYLLLYLGGVVASSLVAYSKHKDNPGYRSLGASGAVSAVLFAFILIFPNKPIYLLFIPFGIKAYVLGTLYLVYSHYMSTKQLDNVAHDAHFYGAVFGILITLVFEPSLLDQFVEQITQ